MSRIETSKHLLTTVVVGIMGTLVIDCWTLLLNSFGVGSRGLLFLGRWIMYLPEGKFFHNTIIQTTSIANELSAGRIAHYCIGIAFTFLLIAIYRKQWIMKPRVMPAIYIGLISLFIPLFVLQPMLGFGIAFSKLPNAGSLFLKTLSIHLVYGLGLYISARFILFLKRNLGTYYTKKNKHLQ